MTPLVLEKTSILFIIFFSICLHAQQRIVTGTLNDNDGSPLAGVSVIVKNSSVGTETDFDGNYSIKCSLGDILVFNFVGMKTKELKVTSSMFSESTSMIEKSPVENIKTNAYKNALKGIKKDSTSIPSIHSSEYTYTENYYFNYNNIKNISIHKQEVKLNYFSSDIYFETGFNTTNGFQFAKKSNLPQLQNTFSQGNSVNGSLSFQGPETGTIFSYGPQINNLEFDGTDYEFDANGSLVSQGSGNGNKAKTYTNKILNTSLKSSHHLFFSANTKTSFLRFDYTHKTEKDLFNIEKNNSNDALLQYENKPHDTKKLSWNAFLKYSNRNNNQPNNNGFLNNILLNNWSTPASFNNEEGAVLANETQRSFSPNIVNNPYWLLKNNRNSEQNNSFVASLQNKLKLSDRIKLNSKLSYTTNKNAQNFGLVKHTVGFENGYLSHRKINKNNFNGLLNFTYNNGNYHTKLKIFSTTKYTYENANYKLTETTGFDNFSFDNGSNNSSNTELLNRNKLSLLNKITYTLNDSGLDISLSNNSYFSSLQNDKWFLPTFQFKMNLDRLLDIYDFSDLSITASTSFDVNDTSLVYNNQSHNSLIINPAETLEYLATNDLFVNNTIKLEEKESYEIATNAAFTIFNTHFNVTLTHFNTKTKKAVFPVFENNLFQLKNTADIINKGFEAELSTRIRLANDFYYSPTITFSSNRTNVSKLADDQQSIAIAGFSSTSKNLIVGKPAGVIVGSAYARNEDNTLIIDENGFPLVAEENKIIGDPTPNFNLGFSNLFRWKNIILSFVIDAQSGGDVWNGTQNTLNYFGTSQQSATERNTTNFIFDGVNEEGSTNTIPVDFYNPENNFSDNKFVRYGFEGVAEDAIEDGSYINLKSISLSYKPIKNQRNKLIKELEFGVYAYNLLTWSKFNGASPYSSLYGNSAGNGLHFFNAPILSEVGFKLNIKI